MTDSLLETIRRRRERAWGDRGTYQSIYADVYDFCCPYRRPAGRAEGQRRTDHLFDNTGIVSTFRGAGQLQQDIFPPGQIFFNLKPGPIAKAIAATQMGQQAGSSGGPSLDQEHDLAWFERQLDSLSAQVQPFFLTGEWDNAVSEMCVDLYVGTGAMLIVEGDDDNPIRFVTLPIDEIAGEADPFGGTAALYWKTLQTRRQIATEFPDSMGSLPKEFHEQLKNDPEGKVLLHQDFVYIDKSWQFIASIDGIPDVALAQQDYKTQPFIASRFYKVPGEWYGRGPAQMALPSVKTLNKAMELSLKNFAIQMLGLWGYRPGGTFVPETAPLRPGGFWPMQATGGVMGPDVFRLDAGGNTASLQNLVLGELRQQIQASLHDEQLPDGGATPKSAAEIMARVQRMKQNYVGAYGRMIHEVIPVAIRRVLEIAHKRQLIVSDIAIDKLLVTVEVISPIAQALRADHYKSTVEAMQLVAQLEGPQAVARRFDVDRLLPEMIRDLGVDSNYVRTVKELAAFDQQSAQKAQAQQVTQAMLAKPDSFAAALSPDPDAQQQATRSIQS